MTENSLTSSSASSLQERQGQTATIKGRSPSKRQRQQKATQFGSLSKILDVLSQAAQLELDTDVSGKASTDNSKLARLSMVVRVLRDATMEKPEQNGASSFGFEDFRSVTLTPVCEEDYDETGTSSLDIGARNSYTHRLYQHLAMK